MSRYTDEQIIEALESEGSTRKAAQKLGMDYRGFMRRKKALAQKGYSPEHDMRHMVPDGYKVKGVSTFYNKEGKPAGQWVKSTADNERMLELMRASMDAMVKDLPPAKRITAPAATNADLLAVYPMGDPHFGEYIWGEECGQDWDLQIAHDTHVAAMRALVEAAPPASEALVINLGDAMHYDSMAAVTPRSGHHLDADGRYAKMVDVLIMGMRAVIDSALRKHDRVRVVNVIGNHDETGALWLARLCAAEWRNNPRVTVDMSPSVFMYHKFGANFIGMHHGHTAKGDKLPAVMATDRAKDWGDTLHRYWYTGHIHHSTRTEYPGCIVESFGTLAPNDSYATNGGWRSRQMMSCLILHAEHGEVARHTVNPKMVL